MTTLVSISTQGDVALVVINHPPVNALSHQLRSALYEAVQKIERSPVRVAILLCEGKTFIAGADISEFGQPLLKPTNPDLIATIEASTKLWIAALHGTVLGAGLELALGCDARLALASTQLGFPEVTLGLIPGAGGTQRLPRLIGLAPALNIITSGKRLSAQQAKTMGLIDAVVEHDLRAAALDYAATLTAKQSLAARVTVSDQIALGETLSAIVKTARGQVAPVEAAHAVMLSTELPLAEGIKQEREIFETLTRSAQSRALRYQFFAEREAAKIPALENVTPTNITTVGIVGGGTMGCGIAMACLQSGFSVVLVDQNDAALAKAWASIDAELQKAKARGLLNTTPELALEHLVASTDLSELKRCDLVIEAVYEDMDIKKSLLVQLGAILPASTLLASNTSYLDIDELAQASARADRFLGLHFFAPAQIMKLVEIVAGKKTVPQTLGAGFALAKALQKTGVLSHNSEGFIGNRIWQAYRRECEYLLEDGSSPYEIDAAMQQFGFALGPFAVADMSGLDIACAQRQRRAGKRPDGERYVEIPDFLCDAGRLGRKTGKGWYDYKDGKAVPSDEVLNIIVQERARKGFIAASPRADTVQARLLAVIVNEASKLLDEHVALRASDIDVVMVKGYGWPKWRGGPLCEADEIGVANMLPLLVQLADKNGLIISQMLTTRAMQNLKFVA